MLFQSGLEDQSESGKVSSRQMYDVFCQQTGARPDFDANDAGRRDIFRGQCRIKPILGGLITAGKRVGLLSNTNECHWQWCSSAATD